jgi:hypothetical protein
MKKTILIASILLIHNCHDCAPKEYPEFSTELNEKMGGKNPTS